MNKIDFVDGTIYTQNHDFFQYHSWIIYNHVVIVWIFNSISKEISATTLYFDNAKDIWVEL